MDMYIPVEKKMKKLLYIPGSHLGRYGMVPRIPGYVWTYL